MNPVWIGFAIGFFLGGMVATMILCALTLREKTKEEYDDERPESLD